MKNTFLTALLTVAAAVANPVAAASKAPLPGGGWLSLERQALRLFGADGREHASLPIRGKQLDLRTGSMPGATTLALLIDANGEQALPVIADIAGGRLLPQTAIPAPTLAPEALCLYRDGQQLDYAFIIAKDGQAEQWLLTGVAPRLVRKMALPPHAKQCRVDDQAGTLFVYESGVGLWAYGADAEGANALKRQPVAMHAPLGTLPAAAVEIAIQPGGVAMEDGDGKQRHGFRLVKSRWTLSAPRKAQAMAAAAVFVEPRVQTDPMTRLGDAADDPAIWRHPSQPSKSRVLGTNKKQGLLVYDLQGKQMQLLESGRLNNVDLRQDVRFGESRFDLAAATQRDDNAVVLYSIGAEGEVAEAARFPTSLEHIYGICLYQPQSGGLEAFVNDKDGSYLHLRIGRSGKQFTSTQLRRFKVASQPEGCVADDRSGRLFVGEEKRGVWSTAADASKAEPLRMVLPVGPQLHADVEGMALYQGDKESYLVVSSQGSNSYVVLDTAPPHKVRGEFRIGLNAGAGIDGASETDGLDVSSANFGGLFASGILVVQDGYKRLPDGPQNFKYVAWDDVAKALGLPSKH